MRAGATVIAGFAVLGLWFALAVVDRLNPLERTRAEDRSVIVTAADGTLLRAFVSRDGRWRLPIKPEQVDARYLRLLLAWEDQRFRDHPGVDPLAVARATYQLAAEARVVSGASTISMQVARLMEPRQRTFGAKFLQMARALQLEWHLSKGQILELYLTLTPYGGSLEGVRAASFAWFGKEPRYLTAGEAALLVALPQSPERRRPDRNAKTAKATRDRVLNVLAARGALTWREAKEAMLEPIPVRRLSFPFHAPHLAQELLTQNTANSPVIVSTLDARVQVKLEALARREHSYFDDDANFAAIIVENASSNVIAHLGGADFWGLAGQLDLTEAPRSPGSTLKPFIYGMAFDDLVVHPKTLIDDRPFMFGDYEPRNFDRGFQGTVTVEQALKLSLNVPAVALLDRVGPIRLAARLSDAGAKLQFPKQGALPSLPLALGGVGITLRDLTMLYTGVAAGGTVRPLRFTTAAKVGKGERLFGRPAAWYLFETLKNANLPDGWSMGQGVERERDIAFKTGTSYGYRDAWSVGFSKHYTTGIWVGRADGSTRPGHIGRNEAASLLLKVFALLPAEERSPPDPPDGAYVVANADQLPPALQHFRVRPVIGAGAQRIQPLRIAFPPDGATVALDNPHNPQLLPLKARGGRLPLRWVINGLPLDSPNAWWRPDGEGFARITVVDADGRADTAQVRLQADK